MEKLNYKNLLEFLVEHYNDEQFLKADGFDDAVIGFCYQSRRLIYSTKKCLNILIDDGMSYTDAVEYMSFNVLALMLEIRHQYLQLTNGRVVRVERLSIGYN